jgi:hypothetical protein
MDEISAAGGESEDDGTPPTLSAQQVAVLGNKNISILKNQWNVFNFKSNKLNQTCLYVEFFIFTYENSVLKPKQKIQYTI